MKTKKLTTKNIKNFQNKIWKFYKSNKRDLPWRNTKDPYNIVVSEFMLQQTQVNRVTPKYELFLKTFPTWEKLAKANYKQVYKVWQGLGYNRRARQIRDLAKIVVKTYKGKLPHDEEQLKQLPGIGPATASAIVAFAYNLPTIYLETNVRSVFIHEFFQDEKDISDKDILPLIQQTLVLKEPRQWYYAILDFGAHIKSQHGNPNKASKHYAKQSAFQNSQRQARGNILRILLKSPLSFSEITKLVSHPNIKQILKSLVAENLIELNNKKYRLK